MSSHTNATKDDAASCPLCGGPNRCALADDPSATECWCDSKKFPRKLLAGLPRNVYGRVCICQKCLEEFTESIEDTDSPS